MTGFPTFKASWPWPWIRSYYIPSCITHRPLPTYQISLKSKKLFVDGRTDGRLDGRTDGRTDGHLRPTLLGRLRRVDLKMLITVPVQCQQHTNWFHLTCVWLNQLNYVYITTVDWRRTREPQEVWKWFTSHSVMESNGHPLPMRRKSKATSLITEPFCK